MAEEKRPVAIVAAEAPPRTKPTNYPQPFASRMKGRVKRPLGDLFGLKNFGVNLTRLAPGAVSALRHSHSRQGRGREWASPHQRDHRGDRVPRGGRSHAGG